MAIDKNKKGSKSGKKGARKRVTDPFVKKEWYYVKAPQVFPVRDVGRTIATKTSGTKIARDTLLGRIFEISLGDLKPDGEDQAFRKFKLKVEEVSTRYCLTNFHGMDITTDKLRSLVKKWQTLIEAHVDIKTTDGYMLRLFCIAFTKKQPNSRRTIAYAQSSQVRRIRKRMVDIIQKETSNVDLHGLVDKLMSETIGLEIEKRTQSIYPLQNVLIRKVKMLRTPKVDISKLMELHGGEQHLVAGAPEAVIKKVDLGQAVGKKDTKKKGKGKGGKEKAEEGDDDDEEAQDT